MKPGKAEGFSQLASGDPGAQNAALTPRRYPDGDFAMKM